MRAELLIVAGEASGDQHGAGLVRALRELEPGLSFFGMGGPAMAGQGVERLYGAEEISVMGLTEVLPRIPRILSVLDGLARAAAARRPALAVLIDVPDFNFRLARRLRRLGIPVVWYVAPMAWAWRAGRTRDLAALVDRLLCILPFEEAFFRERGVDAVYVGSPVAEHAPAPRPAAEVRAALGLEERPTLAIAPGSRRSELSRLLPTLVETARTLSHTRPGLQLVVPVAPGLPPELVKHPFLAAGLAPRFLDGQLVDAVAAADVAVVTSGTATLEAGLTLTPLVAVYRLSPLTHLAARQLVQLEHFSLVNLLLGGPVIPELLQGQVTPEGIVGALEPLWAGPGREACVAGLGTLREVLGTRPASSSAAEEIRSVLRGPRVRDTRIAALRRYFAADARTVFDVRPATEHDVRPAADALANALSLKALGPAWLDVPREAIGDHLSTVLEVNLVYGGRVAGTPRWPVDALVDLFGADVRCVTSGSFSGPPDRPSLTSWTPLTDATFDVGVAVHGNGLCGLLVRHDED